MHKPQVAIGAPSNLTPKQILRNSQLWLFIGLVPIQTLHSSTTNTAFLCLNLLHCSLINITLLPNILHTFQERYKNTLSKFLSDYAAFLWFEKHFCFSGKICEQPQRPLMPAEVSRKSFINAMYIYWFFCKGLKIFAFLHQVNIALYL